MTSNSHMGGSWTDLSLVQQASVAAFNAQLQDHRQLEAMFDVLPDIYFYVKNEQSQWMHCNGATLTLLGFTRLSEVIGKTEHDFFPKRIADAIRLDDLEVIQHGKRIINRTELIVDERGCLIWVASNKLPISDLAGEICGLMGTTCVLQKSELLPDSYRQFSAAIAFIQQNYHQPIDVKALARMSCLSDSQFRKRFKALFNLPPQKFILKVRIQAACHLLRTTNETLLDIAERCGFCDQSYFTRQFRDSLDISPGKYRRRWGRNL